MKVGIGSDSGLTVYAQIRNSSDAIYQGAFFETYVAAHWTTYANSLTEQTSSGYYSFTFPLSASGDYVVIFYQQIAGSPALGDTFLGSRNVTIDSSTVVTPVSGNTDAAYQTQIANIDAAIATLIANPRPNYTVGSVTYQMGDFLAKLYDIREKILKAWKEVPADGWETTQQDINYFGQDLDAYLNESQ